MQVRWNYKLLPNHRQSELMEEWLVTLRKHRNYCLRERESGWNSNNRDVDLPIVYANGSYCDVNSRIEYGSCCPLTCPVVKHGVLSANLIKVSKGIVQWGNASDIQSKRTSELRHENNYYSRIDSGVLQRNLAKLDAAYSGFWQHQRGFPSYRKSSNFKSFEYKPGRCKFEINARAKTKHCYSQVYLPGIGWMKYFDSRPIPANAEPRTITIKRLADGWYISVLLNLPEQLPPVTKLEEVRGINGIDVGINQLIASSDGSLVENPRFATNKRTQRRLRIRQRRVTRKQKGSKNRAKVGQQVARLHQKVKERRTANLWRVANLEVKRADAIAHEDLNVVAMKKRCQPKRVSGRFMPNGQSAKRGLNRAISDASWGQLFGMIGWLAAKSGKPVIKYNPLYTSQECSKCHYTSKDNRNGEKFICTSCGHIDHADTQAARTGLKRVGLIFPKKKLPVDCGKVMPVRDGAALQGKRQQGRNLNQQL